MKNTINILDFKFEQAGYGHFKVTFISPVTGKKWTKTIDNMLIIDRTRNADEPTKKDLQTLKKLVKL
jgi:predicted Rdx family selenoprotein